MRCATRRLLTVFAGVLLAIVASCTPPDRPIRVIEPLPEGLLTLLEPDTVRARFVGDGLSYHYLWAPSGPWAIHVLRLQMDRCELGLAVLSAGRDLPSSDGLATVSALVEAVGEGVLAAVNGDFFTAEGRPLGPEVADGEILRSRARPAFSWRPGVAPWIGQAQMVQGEMEVGFRLSSDGSGYAQVLGGFPVLLDHGADVTEVGVDPTQSFAAARHPRTAVGYDASEGRLWLFAVDGRQGAYSSGMTLTELTALLASVGSTDALNLDGGGSTIMVVDGVARSHPSDEKGERAVRNALAVVADPAYCAAQPQRAERD